MFSSNTRKKTSVLFSKESSGSVTPSGKRKREQDQAFPLKIYEGSGSFNVDVCGTIPANISKHIDENSNNHLTAEVYSRRSMYSTGWTVICLPRGKIFVWKQEVQSRGPLQTSGPPSSLLRAEGPGPHMAALGASTGLQSRRGAVSEDRKAVLAVCTTGTCSYWPDHRNSETCHKLELPLSAEETVTCCRYFDDIGFFIGTSKGHVYEHKWDKGARLLPETTGVFQTFGRYMGYGAPDIGQVCNILVTFEVEDNSNKVVVACGAQGIGAWCVNARGIVGACIGMADVTSVISTKIAKDEGVEAGVEVQVLDTAFCQGNLVVAFIASFLSDSAQGFVVGICSLEVNISRKEPSVTPIGFITLPDFAPTVDENLTLNEVCRDIVVELVIPTDAEHQSQANEPVAVHAVWANSPSGVQLASVVHDTSSLRMGPEFELSQFNVFGKLTSWKLPRAIRCLGVGSAQHVHGLLVLDVDHSTNNSAPSTLLLASWANAVHSYIETGGVDGPNEFDETDAFSDFDGQTVETFSKTLTRYFREGERSLILRLPEILRPTFKAFLSNSIEIATRALVDAIPAGHLVNFALKVKLEQHWAWVDWLRNQGLTSARRVGQNSSALARLAILGEKLAACIALAELESNMKSKNQGFVLQQAIRICLDKDRGRSASMLDNTDLSESEIFFGEPSKIHQIFPCLTEAMNAVVDNAGRVKAETYFEVASMADELLKAAINHRNDEKRFYNVQFYPSHSCWTSEIPVRNCIIELMANLSTLHYENNFLETVATELAPRVESLTTILLQGFESEAIKQGSKDGSCLDEEQKNYYQIAKTTSLTALRLCGKTELAFAMAKKYFHFESIIEIWDETRQADIVQLIELFKEIKGTCADVFPVFCLKWFKKNNKHFDLLDVGSKMPDILGNFLQTRPHLLWYHCIQTKQFEKAATTLLLQAIEERRNHEQKLFSASLGKLCDFVSKSKPSKNSTGSELEEERILAESFQYFYSLLGLRNEEELTIKKCLEYCIEVLSQDIRQIPPELKFQAANFGLNVAAVAYDRCNCKGSAKDQISKQELERHVASIWAAVIFLDETEMSSRPDTNAAEKEEFVKNTYKYKLLQEQYSRNPALVTEMHYEERAAEEASKIPGTVLFTNSTAINDLECCMQLLNIQKRQ